MVGFVYFTPVVHPCPITPELRWPKHESSSDR